MKEYSRYFNSIATIFILILIWGLVTELRFVNPLFLPRVKDTFTTLKELLLKLETYNNLALTTYRSLAGLLLSIIVGVPVGLMMARIKWLYNILELPIEFFRAIPSSALFPLFILIFGIGDSSKIAVVFYACSLIIIINSYYGAVANQERTDRINLLKTMKATKYQVFKYVVFKDALPNISAGIRISLSLSFVLVVVTEMFLGSNNGLGKMLYDYYLQYKIPEMYSSIIILGLTGFFLNKLYIYFEKKYIFWQKN